MRLQHEFVVPLSVQEAQRLVTELERYAPRVPGLELRVTVHARDNRSATVRLAGELRPGGGLRRAVVVDLAARLLREYARRVQAQAQERMAERRAAGVNGSAGTAGTAANAGTAGTAGTAATGATAGAAGTTAAAAAAAGGERGAGAGPGAEEDVVRSGRIVRGPKGPRSSRPPGARAAGRRSTSRTDVWAAVTDPIGAPTQGGRGAPVPVRRSRPALPSLPVSARDVVAVAAVAAAVAVVGRLVRRRRP